MSRVVVITGASSGIGACCARLFAARGDRVVLAARRVEKLDELKDELTRDGREAIVIPTDLADVEQAEILISRTVELCGRIDVLVNNAGYGSQCQFVEMKPEEIERMFTVNVLAAMTLARAAVKEMLSRQAGSIINVASVGGVMAHPLNVVYCATKHALVGFSRSLRLELKGTGVGVTAICPGATRTEFFEVAHTGIPFDDMIETFAAPPEKIARAIVKASGKNRAVVFPTWGAWFLYVVEKWCPGIGEMGNIHYRDRVLRSLGR